MALEQVLIFKLLILLTLANGTPVLLKKLLGQRFAWPLDAGLRFFDAQPLLGPAKTMRGVLGAVLVTALGGVTRPAPSTPRMVLAGPSSG